MEPRRLTRVIAVVLVLATLALPELASAGAAVPGKTLVGALNLNEASVDQLCMLPGIGPAKAARIVEHRTRRPFHKAWEVTKVRGIGPAFFQRYKDQLRVDGQTTLAWVDATSTDRDAAAAATARDRAVAP